MKYQNNIKKRMVLFAVWLVLGALLTVAGVWKEMSMLTSVGFALAAVGLVRIIRYIYILGHPSAMERMEVFEKDERIISITHRARSLAFAVFAVVAAVAGVVFQVLGEHLIGMTLSYSVCGLLGVYLICYFIMMKKG